MTTALSPLGPLIRCERCRELLDEDDLFCPSCGHEAPPRPGEEYQPAGRIEVHRFECTGCGATLTWESDVQALRCAFCGQASLEERPPVCTPVPQGVVPFALDQAQADALFRQWLGKGLFRPGDLRQASTLTEMRGVYLPYWSFSVECDTYWTADSNATPAFARADWAPHFGAHRARYQGVTVPASGALELAEIHALGAYDFEKTVPYASEILAGHPAEAFAVTRKRARVLAGQGFEERVKADCLQQIPGSRHRNLHVNTLFTGAFASPLLLPVWIVAYEYRGKPYRFLVNGQTGQAHGTAPVSPWRVLAAVLLVALLLVLIILLSGP